MKSANPGELCEHYSHQLRSPLGVALGVLDDLLQGLKVDEEDLRDARQALQKMRTILDEMRERGKGE